jgi:hypothetical protein
MWRVVLGTALVLLLLVGWTFAWFSIGAKMHEGMVRKDGMAGLGGAKILRDGADIMNQLMNPQINVMDPIDFLSTETSTKIQAWLATYNKWREK